MHPSAGYDCKTEVWENSTLPWGSIVLFHCIILSQHFMYYPKPIKLRVMKNYEASTAQDQWFHSQYWKKITSPPHYFVCMAGPHSPPGWLRVRLWMNVGAMTAMWYTVIMKHPHQRLKRSVYCSYIYKQRNQTILQLSLSIHYGSADVFVLLLLLLQWVGRTHCIQLQLRNSLVVIGKCERVFQAPDDRGMKKLVICSRVPPDSPKATDRRYDISYVRSPEIFRKESRESHQRSKHNIWLICMDFRAGQPFIVLNATRLHLSWFWPHSGTTKLYIISIRKSNGAQINWC